MKSISADKVIKTINWMVNDDYNDSLLESIRKDDLYVCEIRLPLIEKTVIGIGDSKIDSIDNATKQASNLIDEYLSASPHVTVENYFNVKEYVLEEDDNGYLSIHLKKRKL